MHICAYTLCMCIYVYVCMCMRIHAYTLCIYIHISVNIYIYIYIYTTHYKNHSHTSAGVVYRSSLFETSLPPIYCLGEKVNRGCNLSMTSSKEKLCVGGFPHPQFPLSHPSSATSLYFGHKHFAKITKLPNSG